MILRHLFAWAKPAPAARPFTDDELAEALRLRRVVLVRPHVRKAPTNPKRDEVHAKLRQELGRA